MGRRAMAIAAAAAAAAAAAPAGAAAQEWEPPFAPDASVVAEAGVPLAFRPGIRGTDVDVSVSDGALGAAGYNGTHITYVPRAGVTGTDRIEYAAHGSMSPYCLREGIVCMAAQPSSHGTVYVTVAPAGGPGGAPAQEWHWPSAPDWQAATDGGAPLAFAPAIGGTGARIVWANAGASGDAAHNGTHITYAPREGADGTHTIGYAVEGSAPPALPEGAGPGAPRTAYGTVSVTVAAAGAPPGPAALYVPHTKASCTCTDLAPGAACPASLGYSRPKSDTNPADSAGSERYAPALPPERTASSRYSASAGHAWRSG